MCEGHADNKTGTSNYVYMKYQPKLGAIGICILNATFIKGSSASFNSSKLAEWDHLQCEIALEECGIELKQAPSRNANNPMMSSNLQSLDRLNQPALLTPIEALIDIIEPKMEGEVKSLLQPTDSKIVEKTMVL
jgi:hypothetical protein